VACPPAALMFIQSFSKLHPLVQKLNEEGETYMRVCFLYTLPTFLLFLISKKDSFQFLIVDTGHFKV
jgi:hypothetical protein